MKKPLILRATVFINMQASTEDYVLAICITWMMMIGYFIVITREITLLIGLTFPLLILLLLRSRKEKKHLQVLQLRPNTLVNKGCKDRLAAVQHQKQYSILNSQSHAAFEMHSRLQQYSSVSWINGLTGMHHIYDYFYTST